MKKFCTKLFLFSARHQKLLWGMVFLISCLAVYSVVKSHYSADMLMLLPENSRSYKDLNAVLHSGLANRMTVYFSRKDGGKLDNEKDSSSIQAFAEELGKIKGINQVVCSPVTASQEQLYSNFVQYFPLLYSPDQLPVNGQLSSCIQKKFRMMCINPVGGSLQCKYDIFNWTTPYLLKLENILKISGLQFDAGNSSFILSPDRKYCMLLVYTDAEATDYKGSIALQENIQKLSAKLPEHLTLEYFSPHSHMLENAEIMKKDLRIFTICTLILFAALFAFIYKYDWRGLVIPALASLGGFWAAAVMGKVFGQVLLFTLAMGGVLIGIAGDYGIHLYAASLSQRQVQNGIRLVPKLFLAFLTTATAFAGFIFSGVPAFSQFGTYSVLTLFFAFILLLVLLPGILFFNNKKHKAVDFSDLLKLEKISRKHAWAAFFVLLVFLPGLLKIRFDTDIRKFDIAYKSSMEKEAKYKNAFTKTAHPYLLLHFSETFDGMLEKCKKDKEELQKKFPDIKIISPSDFFIPHSVQKKNLRLWDEFIQKGAWRKYKEEFLHKASAYGFTEEFFSAFFAGIEKSVKDPPQKQPEMLQFTYKNLIGKTSDWTGVVMVDKKTISNDMLRKNTTAVIFSEDIFTNQLFRDILGNLPNIIPWVLLTVFLCVFATLRSFSKTCLAFLPVAVCLISIAGIHGLLDLEITLAVVVAGIITVGISVDYGLLLVNSDMDKHIFNSIAFSAITTAAGGFTVLFTHHPMLRAAGLTIVTGILSSCFFSFCLLNPLLRRIKKKNMEKTTLISLLVILCTGVSGCSSLPVDTVLPLRAVPETASGTFPVPDHREFQGNIRIDYRTGQVAFLIAGKLDPDGTGRFHGFSPAGIKLFSLEGKGYELTRSQWTKSVVSERNEKMLSVFMYRAVASSLYVPSPAVSVQTTRTKEKSLILTGHFADGSSLRCTYSGEHCENARRQYEKKGESFLVEYCKKQQDFHCIYIYSDRSFFQAYIKMSFYK